MICRDAETTSYIMREFLTEMYDWCEEFVGPPDNTLWTCDTLYVMFTFKEEQDAFAFRLRWC
ncbi:MAG: hypothetical protein EOP84_12650 [Verrucomicrobiaceae bacterium]|nr:MAG: hypothetical protein EOP84_12650 [Verrucomicrobiaceae bacterium]